MKNQHVLPVSVKTENGNVSKLTGPVKTVSAFTFPKHTDVHAYTVLIGGDIPDASIVKNGRYDMTYHVSGLIHYMSLL